MKQGYIQPFWMMSVPFRPEFDSIQFTYISMHYPHAAAPEYVYIECIDGLALPLPMLPFTLLGAHQWPCCVAGPWSLGTFVCWLAAALLLAALRHSSMGGALPSCQVPRSLPLACSLRPS